MKGCAGCPCAPVCSASCSWLPRPLHVQHLAMLRVVCNTQACTLCSLGSACSPPRPPPPCNVQSALLTTCHSLPAAPPAAAVCLCSSHELCATHVTETMYKHMGVPPALPAAPPAAAPGHGCASPQPSAGSPCAPGCLPAASHLHLLWGSPGNYARRQLSGQPEMLPGLVLKLQRPIDRCTARHATRLGAFPTDIDLRAMFCCSTGFNNSAQMAAKWTWTQRQLRYPKEGLAAHVPLDAYPLLWLLLHYSSHRCGRLGRPGSQLLGQCLFWGPMLKET